MKRFLAVVLLIITSVIVFAPSSYAAEKKYQSWNAIIDEMDSILNDSYDIYFMKDSDRAKERVNNAYFGFYEKHGVERAVMSYISGKRGTDTEYQFAKIKRLMTDGAPNKTVRAEIDVLLKMLHEDANELDGKKESGWSILLASFIIIFREGLEAILVIAAISAYLVRSGNLPMVKVVYMSSLFAIFASVLAAIALHSIFDISGANQEMIEGVAMLLATVVLFFVSNWMFSKAEAKAWKNYVEGKVQTAVSSGSRFALGFAAFLAVFREGAETILFYQAMLAEAKDHMDMVWYGLAVGCIVLAIIFMLIRFGTMKLPIRPFFIGTSTLMYIMAIAFAGGGVKELQEADIIPVTPVDFVHSIDILGIYPTIETLIPQIFMILVVIISVVYLKAKHNKQNV
ncbi:MULTISPECIES: FTR1 family iron permease [unclassified Gilliamella]|uniref:FTR1 family iron permease n=1 Tax=unclassified Gilliamella TaxID=2685620 RepID=UPI002269882A|nr:MULTISPECIES: FTR1 family protein [unclassified Gilliamella]MCX8642186.1 FTR1 family iron permease [Gilliamella sp. B3835]MCX8707372.1 FTR1 family iron permease [Gilliamella sp. B3783]MCX8710719.1 FTR1 family iron permease [Gilliamella sp. B3780]MCX8711719.1 FTR1 family iron permease [Gilliamella sp. B3468]MCX8715261.1 FTR1 family iron permease [Gilliamella sp. B3781]